MNIPILNYIFAKANEEDYLKIEYGTKFLEIPKRFFKYQIKGKGYYLEIYNTGKKETYLIKTDSIDLITIIEPKFKPKSWWEDSRAKAGA